MSELREVPPKTPIADAVEETGKAGKIAAFFMRIGKAWQARRSRKKQQQYIDRTYHDALRAEGMATVYRSEPPPRGVNAPREDLP